MSSAALDRAGLGCSMRNNAECKQCAFFVEQDNGVEANRLRFGTCRKDPPAVIRATNKQGEEVPRTFWPTPYMADPRPWCGEFRSAT